MKEILAKMLKLIARQSDSSAQVAADVRALKAVICAMGPEFQSALDEQASVEKGRFESHTLDLPRVWLKSLDEAVAKMPD